MIDLFNVFYEFEIFNSSNLPLVDGSFQHVCESRDASKYD